jgi:hypothetical protein
VNSHAVSLRSRVLGKGVEGRFKRDAGPLTGVAAAPEPELDEAIDPPPDPAPEEPIPAPGAPPPFDVCPDPPPLIWPVQAASNAQPDANCPILSESRMVSVC